MNEKELISHIETKREELGYTKTYLSDKTGISAQAYNKIVKNGGGLKLSTAINLLKAVGYEILPIEENLLNAKN